MINFKINIEPTPQMRPRAVKMGAHARMYKDPKQERNDQQLMQLLVAHAPDIPIEKPVIFGAKIFISMPKYIRDTWKREPAEDGIIRPSKMPDLSNFLKGIEDCMTKANFWCDDGQIIGYTNETGKYYSIKPRWEISIEIFKQPRTKREYEVL